MPPFDKKSGREHVNKTKMQTVNYHAFIVLGLKKSKLRGQFY